MGFRINPSTPSWDMSKIKLQLSDYVMTSPTVVSFVTANSLLSLYVDIGRLNIRRLIPPLKFREPVKAE